MFKLHGKSKKYFQKTLKVAGNRQKMNLGNPVIEVFGTSGEQPGLSNQLIKKGTAYFGSLLLSFFD